MSFNGKMKTIADNIRAKTGGTQSLNLEAMADGINEVYEKGRDDRDLKLWQMMTNNGNRAGGEWDRLFAYTDYTDYEFIKPVIIGGSVDRLFYSYSGKSFPKNLDLSTVTRATSLCQWVRGGLYEEGTMTFYDMNLPALGEYPSAFYNARGIKKIEIIRVTDGTTFPSTFSGATYLKEVYFEGTIGQDISFANSPLIVDCVKHIISHLKDYSTDTSNAGIHTLTLHDNTKTAMANLGAIAEFGGKTYDAYITDIGWNLA